MVWGSRQRWVRGWWLDALLARGQVPQGEKGPPPTPPPFKGWSTWNTFGGSVSDALLRESADAMVSTGLRDAGYVYIK